MSPLSKAGPTEVSRRQLLRVSASLFFPVSTLCSAQTFIENSASSGQNWGDAAIPPSTNRGLSSNQSNAPAASTSTDPQPTRSKDWRQYLLIGERSIILRRDGKAKQIRYCTNEGRLDTAGYQEACLLLRDVQADRMYPMDPHLLDVLCGIQRWMKYNGRDSVIDITSGFRTLKTNNATEGSAMNSMHLYGKAADIVISGASSALVGAMARIFNGAGGTGIYLARGFVHIDTGSSRSWVSSV